MPQRRLRRRVVRPQGAKAPSAEEPSASGAEDAAAQPAARPDAPPAESPHFEQYYRAQGICPEDEWPLLVDSLRRGLPAAVRVNRGSHAAAALVSQLRRLRDAQGEQRAYAPRELTWYPHSLGWQWDSLCSWEIRRGLTHRRLKAYLLWLQDHGALTRQEAVSMVPPLCLEVRPEHSVLDLCAAPGSKSSQMLEMLHWEDDATSREPPSGVVVANEIVPKRADLLKHTVQRLGSPCVVVTQLDGQYFPNLVLDGQPLQFDRVLCDVPCSGDGTIRKCPALWGKWSPKDALGLHHKQYTLLCRGLDLLRVGGRLVYSTCSFNPVEDEAVVAAALRRCGGSVVLAPLPQLEGLCGSPGLRTWVVPHPDEAGVRWARHEDVPKELQRKMRASLFPAEPGSQDAEDWERQCGRCRRFLPHRANTGGFFVAVLERAAPGGAEARPARRPRKAEVPSKPIAESAAQGATHAAAVATLADAASAAASAAAPIATASEGVDGGGGAEAVAPAAATARSPAATDAPGGNASVGNAADAKQAERHLAAAAAAPGAEGGPVPGAPPQRPAAAAPTVAGGDYEQVAADDPGWLWAAEFFGLDTALVPRLFRRKDNERKLFCVSEGAARFLSATGPFKLRVPCAGVRVLERLSNGRGGAPAAWRCAQEGLPVLLRHGLKRRVAVSRRVLTRVLEAREIEVEELQAAAHAGEVQGLESVLRSGSTSASCLASSADTVSEGGTTADTAAQPPAVAASAATSPAATPGVVLSGGLALTLMAEGEEPPPAIAVAALLSGRRLQSYVTQSEAAALLESLELERRTEAILRGEAVDARTAEQLGGAAAGASSGEEVEEKEEAPAGAA